MASIGAKISTLRKNKGVTQAKLAEDICANIQNCGYNKKVVDTIISVGVYYV
ncbi:MAG: helix-turn-helix transcriptional regulator [Clostridiales bacterium]|nr:helix-turn-helix transcriptional regulator [Clostridiales bacterium]